MESVLQGVTSNSQQILTSIVSGFILWILWNLANRHFQVKKMKAKIELKRQQRQNQCEKMRAKLQALNQTELWSQIVSKDYEVRFGLRY